MTTPPGPQESPPTVTRMPLAEQLMLLAFPSDGPLRMGPGSYLSAGLVGAVLTELTFGGCVTIEPHGRSAGRCRVVALGPRTGDPFFDGLVDRIAGQPPNSLSWWIRRGANRSALYADVLARLTAQGLVTTSRGLLRSHSRLVSPAVRADPANRMQRSLLIDPVQAGQLWSSDPGAASLVSLAFACRAVTGFGWLPRQQRAGARAVVKALRSTDPIGQAVAAFVSSQASTAATNASMTTTMIANG
jgi:Golgi phosphoprotein 3 (GPP34)